jgi:hypothetical protein
MPAVKPELVVTRKDGQWRGDWGDGYAVIVQECDTTRIGVYRTVLDVEYGQRHIATLSVDLLSAHSCAAFTMSMSSRNGVPP